MKNKWKQNGMLTVEASLIISLTIIVVGIMLSILFHAYRNCWYTQAGCESVLAGSSQGVLKNYSGLNEAQKRWKQLEKEFYMVPKGFEASISEKGENLIFHCKGVTNILGLPDITMKVEIEQRVCKPVVYIRKIMKIHNMVGNEYDSGV